MKKLGLLFLLIAGSTHADVSDNLSYLSSKTSSYLNPLSYADINRNAGLLRTGLKSTLWVGSWVTGMTYDKLQKSKLYPRPSAVPASVQNKLTYFDSRPVMSPEVPGAQPSSLLRKDVLLGDLEKTFVANRLNHAASKVFAEASPTTISRAPDTDPARTPYGFALDTGLKEVGQAPRIATCFSGGGFRAMIATLGAWQALSDMGIADAILYSANLSGSTWNTIPWCMGAPLKSLSQTYAKYAKVGVNASMADDIKKFIYPGNAAGYKENKLNISDIQDKFLSAFLYEQPLSSVRGVWGPLIAQMTLKAWDDEEIRAGSGLDAQASQYLYLFQAMDFIADGTKRPFPIATSLVPFESNFRNTASKIAKKQKTANGLWMEFNPEYVGFEYFGSDGNLTGAWIPSYSLGRVFEEKVKDPSRFYRIFTNKKVIGYVSKSAPAHTVDYWMGTWGSAFTVSPGDIYRIFFTQKPDTDTSEPKTSSASSITNRLISYLGSAMTSSPAAGNAKNIRLYPALFNNFAKFEDSPITADTFTAVDAGIDFNVPFPPLLRAARGVDLIICGDWSAPTADYPAKELQLAEKWANARGVPFPKIAKSKELSHVYDVDKPMTLFNEYEKGKPTGPAILYIPLNDNIFNEAGFTVDTCLKNACSTFNFDYNKNGKPDVDNLSKHVQRTLWGVYPQIREVVQRLVESKNHGYENFTMTQLSTLDELTNLGDAYVGA